MAHPQRTFPSKSAGLFRIGFYWLLTPSHGGGYLFHNKHKKFFPLYYVFNPASPLMLLTQAHIGKSPVIVKKQAHQLPNVVGAVVGFDMVVVAAAAIQAGTIQPIRSNDFEGLFQPLLMGRHPK